MHPENVDGYWRELEAERRWIREQMPMRIDVFLGASDEPLRKLIRGEVISEPQPCQTVIVQGIWEADRIVNAMANLKYKRGLPYGGALQARWFKS